jgi:hypothetical protein
VAKAPTIKVHLTMDSKFSDHLHHLAAQCAMITWAWDMDRRVRLIRAQVRREIAGKFAAMLLQRFPELGDCYTGAPYDHRPEYTKGPTRWRAGDSAAYVIGVDKAAGPDQTVCRILKPRG